MFELNLSSVRSVLCFGAHPDDIEIGCGGTLLKLLQANPTLQVHWVVLSSNPRRRAEAEASFHAWCPQREHCTLQVFEFPDTLFPWHGIEIKQAFHRIARVIDPDLIFTHRREDLHQDHYTLAELTWNAFRNHLILEYEIAKFEGDLGRPNVYVPLTIDAARRKVELLMTHFPSQQDKPWFRAAAFDALMQLRAVESNAVSGFAEAFHARKICLTTAPC